MLRDIYAQKALDIILKSYDDDDESEISGNENICSLSDAEYGNDVEMEVESVYHFSSTKSDESFSFQDDEFITGNSMRVLDEINENDDNDKNIYAEDYDDGKLILIPLFILWLPMLKNM